MRPRISIRGFVRPLVHPSVCPWVRYASLKYRGNEDFKKIKHQGTHRIAFLVEIPENSRKFRKIHENLVKFIGRIVVRIELVLGSHLLPHFVYL